MSQPVPEQHPAVVLRSHFLHLRSMLAIAMIAVVAMAVAVVILASAGTSAQRASTPPQSSTAPAPNGSTRYDGGPEEGTRGALASPKVPTTRYDGGPEEGIAVRDSK
jgi:hypothetical protein